MENNICCDGKCNGDVYQHEIMGKKIQEWFDSHDKFAFKGLLKEEELINFNLEESRIHKQYDALVSKYNKLVSDRVSREILIKEVLSKSKIKHELMQKLLEEYENEVLQKILNVLTLNEEKDDSMSNM